MFFTLIILLIKKAEFTLPAIIPHKRYGIIRVQKPSKNPADHHTHGLNSFAKVVQTERNTKKIRNFLLFPRCSLPKRQSLKGTNK
ncbi:hypothetical protein CIK93_11220 [Prevotella sp. P3-92]|nr:hypothetical protein CIK93_11220 [Prevotella sp. P3-92]